jgi:hypothetical protein
MIQGTADRVIINHKSFTNKIDSVTHILFIVL